jgi:hypothetical protein
MISNPKHFLLPPTTSPDKLLHFFNDISLLLLLIFLMAWLN